MRISLLRAPSCFRSPTRAGRLITRWTRHGPGRLHDSAKASRRFCSRADACTSARRACVTSAAKPHTVQRGLHHGEIPLRTRRHSQAASPRGRRILEPPRSFVLQGPPQHVLALSGHIGCCAALSFTQAHVQHWTLSARSHPSAVSRRCGGESYSSTPFR